MGIQIALRADFNAAAHRGSHHVCKHPSEWHYTPKHGSRLDMAESELGVLSTQCLDRRIPHKAKLIEEVDAWQNSRNKHHAKADWQFKTADARVKLKRLYPRFE